MVFAFNNAFQKCFSLNFENSLSVLAVLNLLGKDTAHQNLKRDKICPSFTEAKKWQLLWSFSKLVSWIRWYRAEEDVASAPISNRQVMGKQKEDRIPRKGLSLKSLRRT